MKGYFNGCAGDDDAWDQLVMSSRFKPADMRRFFARMDFAPRETIDFQEIASGFSGAMFDGAIEGFAPGRLGVTSSTPSTH